MMFIKYIWPESNVTGIRKKNVGDAFVIMLIAYWVNLHESTKQDVTQLKPMRARRRLCFLNQHFGNWNACRPIWRGDRCPENLCQLKIEFRSSLTFRHLSALL